MHLEVLTQKGKNLLPALANFSSFYLAGGTALALQIGHRQSVDFDFFSSRPIKKDLLRNVIKIFSPTPVHPSIRTREELTVFVDSIKITFLEYPYPVSAPYVTWKNIHLLSAREIAVTKAYTIGRRGSWKDYVDLYWVLKGGLLTLSVLCSLAEKKYGIDFNARLFLEQLVYFDDIEEDRILFLKKKVSKKTVETFFCEQIKKMKL